MFSFFPCFPAQRGEAHRLWVVELYFVTCCSKIICVVILEQMENHLETGRVLVLLHILSIPGRLRFCTQVSEVTWLMLCQRTWEITQHQSTHGQARNQFVRGDAALISRDCPTKSLLIKAHTAMLAVISGDEVRCCRSYHEMVGNPEAFSTANVPQLVTQG